MTVHRYIAAVSCVLLLAGCHGDVLRPTTRSSSATPATMPAAGQEALVVGMDLGDALEMLTRHDIDFQIDRGGWGPTKRVAAFQKFIIERRDVDDAFVLYADSEHGERMRVQDLYWYRNYQSDAKLAKGARKYEENRVQRLSMVEIERKFSFALNPWDYEKVRAREDKR
jgi:hypothetical protein